MRVLTVVLGLWLISASGFAENGKSSADLSRSLASDGSSHAIWIPDDPPVPQIELPPLPPLLEAPSPKPATTTTEEAPKPTKEASTGGLPLLLNRALTFRDLSSWLNNLKRKQGTPLAEFSSGEILGSNEPARVPNTKVPEAHLRTYLIVPAPKLPEGTVPTACHHITLKDSETGEVRGDCSSTEIQEKAKTLLVLVNGEITRIRDPFSAPKNLGTGLLFDRYPISKGEGSASLWKELASEGVAMDNVKTVEVVGIESPPLSNFEMTKVGSYAIRTE